MRSLALCAALPIKLGIHNTYRRGRIYANNNNNNNKCAREKSVRVFYYIFGYFFSLFFWSFIFEFDWLVDLNSIWVCGLYVGDPYTIAI